MNPIEEYQQHTKELNEVKERHKRSKRKLVEFLEEHGSYSSGDTKYEMIEASVNPSLGMKRCVEFLQTYSEPHEPIVDFLQSRLSHLPVKRRQRLRVSKLKSI